jgi:hypothetical protein
MARRRPPPDPAAGAPKIPRALRCPPAAPEDIAFWADKGPPALEWQTPAEHAATTAHTNWRQARKAWAEEHGLDARAFFRVNVPGTNRQDFSGHGLPGCPHQTIERD